MKKYISPFLSLFTILYTIWYMHFGNPLENSGALSKIGLTHKLEFVIWGTLTLVTLFYSIIKAFKTNLNTKVYIPFLIVSLIGMILTLSFKFDYDLKPDYYLHCIGSLTFSIVTGIIVFLLFLLCFKKSIIFKIFTFITAIILLTDLILLIIFKETSLIETFPIFSGMIMLSITNIKTADH